MHKTFIIAIATLLLFSCDEKKTYYKQDIVSFLSKEKARTITKEKNLFNISFYTSLPVFISIANDSLTSTTTDDLYSIYNSTYNERYKDFNAFLSDALNQQIKLDKKDFINLQTSFF